MFNYGNEVIKIFPYVIGERNYGLSYYKKYKDNEYIKRSRERSKEVTSKKVKCLDDGIEFPSISEAARYYKISSSAITTSIKENRNVFCRKHNKRYQFSLL